MLVVLIWLRLLLEVLCRGLMLRVAAGEGVARVLLRWRRVGLREADRRSGRRAVGLMLSRVVRLVR